MKIELIKDHRINGVLQEAGTTLEVDDATAAAWQKKGICKVSKAAPAPTPAPVAPADPKAK